MRMPSKMAAFPWVESRCSSAVELEDDALAKRGRVEEQMVGHGLKKDVVGYWPRQVLGLRKNLSSTTGL